MYLELRVQASKEAFLEVIAFAPPGRCAAATQSQVPQAEQGRMQRVGGVRDGLPGKVLQRRFLDGGTVSLVQQESVVLTATIWERCFVVCRRLSAGLFPVNTTSEHTWFHTNTASYPSLPPCFVFCHPRQWWRRGADTNPVPRRFQTRQLGQFPTQLRATADTSHIAEWAVPWRRSVLFTLLCSVILTLVQTGCLELSFCFCTFLIYVRVLFRFLFNKLDDDDDDDDDERASSEPDTNS